jgi:hypothetical protein
VGSDNKNIVIYAWLEEMSEFIARESYNLIKLTGDPKGSSKKLSSMFIRYFVSKMVLDSLTEYKKKKLDGKEAYDFTKKNFSEMKDELQLEIAKGFEIGFLKYSGKDIEYYCQVKPVPEPINKEVC